MNCIELCHLTTLQSSYSSEGRLCGISSVYLMLWEVFGLLFSKTSSAFGLHSSEVEGVKGISWDMRGKRGHCEGASAAVWGNFGCTASGEVQNQELQMEKFHIPIMAMSESRGSSCAVKGMPGGFGDSRLCGKDSTDLDPPEQKEDLCPPGEPDWGTCP